MNQEIYELAKKYREIGWNVIPLYNFSKNPAPIQWKAYQERMSSDEEFENWFRGNRVTGLGLITGRLSGVVVLDEDKYKEGGVPVTAKTGMKAQTARGGLHHYFKYIEPIKSSGFRKGINVEIKADGGFVVLPPTKVVLDGKEGVYEWLETCYPEALMGITEEMLTPFRPETYNEGSVDISELRFAPLGSQHTSLRTLALSEFARHKKTEWGVVEDLIRMEASKYIPPHPEKRVEKIIEDTKRFITTHNKEEVQKAIESEPPVPQSINDLVEERIEDRKLEKVAPHTGWPELDAIIKGFVPKRVYTLTGDTNVGKTTIACNFAEALRRQGKKTLYIALEPDVNLLEYLASVRLRKRFVDITDEDLALEKEDGLIKIFLQRDIKDADELVLALEKMEERFDLIVIDHIGYFIKSDKGWLQQQSNVIKQLAALAKQQKSAIMMIAHLRKPAATQKKREYVPGQDDISGSASFKQDSTEVLIAHRPTQESGFGVQFEDKGILLVTKTKSGPNGGLNLIFPAGTAKIWSWDEANASVDGRMMLETRRIQESDAQYSQHQVDMEKSQSWEQNDD